MRRRWRMCGNTWRNISPRKAKFTLHVPDSELLLSPGMDRTTLKDAGLLNRVITVKQLPLKNKESKAR